MILFEFEGKKLLNRAGIAVPTSQLLSSPADQIGLNFPVVLKAQVLSGKRKDAGGILFAENDEEAQKLTKELFSKEINKEKVEKILVEEKADIDKEYYLSISYNTETRGPLLAISEAGGTGIEDRGTQNFSINPLTLEIQPLAAVIARSEGRTTKQSDQLEEDSGQDITRGNSDEINEARMTTVPLPKEIVSKLITLFFEQDCLLLEVNPLIKTKSGEWMALDAKVKLDDFAKPRHKDEWDYAPRSAPGHTPTRGEIAAKKIDEDDYRGTAGSSYFDIAGGDIAVLSSGGGVSLTALDSLINAGGKPANFTEYSGNPPKEKVAKLTKIVLDKPNIHGLWVIGTVVANFTDIYETLSGFIEGLKQAESELGTKFEFPIVIRRGGPRVEEAYQMLKEIKEFDLHLQGEETSIAQSAEEMAKLAREYAERSNT